MAACLRHIYGCRTKTDSRLQQLEAFYSEVHGARTSLPAFVYFTMLDTQSTKAVEKMIASSLRGRDPIQVIYAALALRNWMDLPDSASSPEFRKLASMVIGIIECGRTIAQQQLLRLARELLTGDRLSDELGCRFKSGSSARSAIRFELK